MAFNSEPSFSRRGVPSGTLPKKGRAGLTTPKRRSKTDLDRSARRRAVETIYFDTDEANISLAKRILLETVDQRHYEEAETRGSDSEDDFAARISASPLGSASLSAQRSRVTEKRSPTVSFNGSPSKKSKPSSVIKSNLSKVESVKSPFTTKSPLPSPSKRVGRPSKLDTVIGRVKNIFQDDAALQTMSAVSAIDFASNPSSAPIISGISESEKKETESQLGRFAALEIPDVDSDGNIIDEDFTKKYLIKTDSKKRILVDDRAFFMEGAEGYFEQKSMRPKSSHNSISSLAPQIDYDEFIPFIQKSEQIRRKEKDVLVGLYRSLFNQWCFELSQGFNLNFYGVGSKEKLILEYLEYLMGWCKQIYGSEVRVLVINGFNRNIKVKEIIQDIVKIFLSDSTKIPKHLSETVLFLIQLIENSRSETKAPKLIMAIHNIDGEVLRDEKTQGFLSLLAALPDVWLLSSTDHVNVSLLWDSVSLRNFNFIWHDVTTYEPYGSEMSFVEVLGLGRSKTYVGSKGAKHVLSSLTEKHKFLYRILLEYQITLLKKISTTDSQKTKAKGSSKLSVDFDVLYRACVEKFVTSSDHNFRTMLVEFIEHKMCTLTKDEAGKDKLFIPFGLEEMEQLLREAFEETQT